jgi:hypothetical protein
VGETHQWLYTQTGAWHQQARLAQSVEHQTLNLVVVGSSPTLGVSFCDLEVDSSFVSSFNTFFWHWESLRFTLNNSCNKLSSRRLVSDTSLKEMLEHVTMM